MNTDHKTEEATGVTAEHTPMEGISAETARKGKGVQPAVEEEESSGDDEPIQDKVSTQQTTPTGNSLTNNAI